MNKTIEEKAAKLLKDLNITKLSDRAKKLDILLQQQLQELMLSYVVDIKGQLILMQEDLISTYPADLISSLKIIADLYLKMKGENRELKVGEDYDSDYVF
jgi:hypothetical protein